MLLIYKSIDVQEDPTIRFFNVLLKKNGHVQSEQQPNLTHIWYYIKNELSLSTQVFGGHITIFSFLYLYLHKFYSFV